MGWLLWFSQIIINASTETYHLTEVHWMEEKNERSFLFVTNIWSTFSCLLYLFIREENIFSQWFFVFHVISWTLFHAGLEDILSHHCFTWGLDSIKSPSPILISTEPKGKWNKSAIIYTYRISMQKNPYSQTTRCFTHLSSHIRLFGQNLFVYIQFEI